MKIPRDFLIGTLSSLFATALVTAMSLVVQGVSPGDISVPVLVPGLYVLLLIGATFVFLSQEQSRINPGMRLPRFGRWPKIITLAGLLVGLVPLVWAFIPYTILPLRIQIRNHSKYAVLISDQAWFHITLPNSPVSDIVVDRGRCQLSWLAEQLQRDKPLLVFPDGTAEMKCQILNPVAYRRFLQSENMDIQVFLTNGQGNVAAATMPLNGHTLENHWLLIEFKDQQRSF